MVRNMVKLAEGAALVLLAAVTEFPSAAVEAWAILPADLKSSIPANCYQWLGVIVLLFTFIGRVVIDARKEKPSANTS